MISETTARASYTANGSTADFAFLFTIYSKNDVEVLRNGTVQQLDTDYQVRADSGLFEALASSSLPAAGSIRFIDGLGVAEPPDSGDIITILRKQAASQSSDYLPGQSFPAASVERDIDKLMMAIQQTRETLARALTFAKKSSLTNGVVDDPTEGYFARAKVGGGIDWAQVVGAGEITIPVPVNEGGTGAENAADARTNLGAVGLTGDETIAGQKTLSDDLTVNGQVTVEALNASGQVTVSVQDSRTNTVATPLIVDAPTSGTPAANIGIGILFKTQSADEAPSDAMKLSAVNSDVGTGSEDTFFQIMLRTAGQALGIAYEFYRTSQFVALFTHANTANRVYTLPDASGTVLTDNNIIAVTGKTVNSSNTLTSCVKTTSLVTATGSASGNAGSDAALTLNDYSFFPNFQMTTLVTGPGALKLRSIADQSDPVGRVTIAGTGDGTDMYNVRWRYITASDDPTIWIAYNPATGLIASVWASDDPTPGDAPGVLVPGLTSVKLKAQQLEPLSVLNARASAAADLIRARRLRMQHQAYRALQLVANDDAPSRWILENCEMVGGAVRMKAAPGLGR